MKYNNFEDIEQSISRKYKKSDKRKNPKMKVSGKSVISLHHIIARKTHKLDATKKH